MSKNTQRMYSYYNQGFRETVELLTSLKKLNVPVTAYRSNLSRLKPRQNAVPKAFQRYYRMGVLDALRTNGARYV